MYIAVLSLFIFVAGYWVLRYRQSAGLIQGPSILVSILALGLTGIILYSGHVDQWDEIGRSDQSPIALAVVFDTSLSMFAGPDPTRYPGVQTRFDRSKEVVMEVLHRLNENRRSVIVSIVVFTVRAANALGWNPNLQEVEQIVNGSLTTNLIGRGGTDLGGALARTVEIFDDLPERLKTSANKFLLLVSDGERTVNMVDLEESLSAFRQRGIKIVSLQVGLLDEPEGIREYDEFGFTGFWRGIGEIYSIPDTNTMITIAGLDDSQGLYIRAEDPLAGRRIQGFLQGNSRILASSYSMEQLLTLGLLVLTVLMLQRLLA